MGSSNDRDALLVFFPGEDLAPVLSKDHKLPVMIDNSLGDTESSAPSSSETRRLKAGGGSSSLSSNFGTVGVKTDLVPQIDLNST